MKIAILMLLTIAIGSCTANVDSTLVGMFSTMVRNAEREAASANGEIEPEVNQDDVAEEAPIAAAQVEPSAEEVLLELQALAAAQSPIEQSQSNLNAGELSKLRDNHAARMSENISSAGMSAGEH